MAIKVRTINSVKLYLFHDRFAGMYRVHDGSADGRITVYCQTAHEAWKCAEAGEWAE